MVRQNETASPVESLLFSEISDQPSTWSTTAEKVAAVTLSLDLAVAPVVLTGAGTSAYAASAIASAWPGAKAVATTDLLLQSPAEIERANPTFVSKGILISIARSGDSPESVGVVKKLIKCFPLVEHLAIVCNRDGKLARMPGVQVIVLDERTNDKSLAMTNSFSNLVLAGLCLLHQTKILRHLDSICASASAHLGQLSRTAEEIASVCDERIVVLTSVMHALAKETSLKTLELTQGRVVAMDETFLGVRHGPLSFLREDTPVLCFASSDPHKQLYEMDLVNELREKKIGRLALIGDSTSSNWKYDWHIPAIAPMLPDELRTPFEIMFSQLVAYQLSCQTGVNPDNPSPNDLVTRVVKGFKVYS